MRSRALGILVLISYGKKCLCMLDIRCEIVSIMYYDILLLHCIMTSCLTWLCVFRSTFAVDNTNMKVNPDVERVLKDFHGKSKPIG